MAGMAGMALVPRAQETFSKSAVEAIKRLQDDKKSLRQDNDKLRTEVKEMRKLLLEMQQALQAAVDENALIKNKADTVAEMEAKLQSCSTAREKAESLCDEQASEIEQLKTALQDAERRSRVVQGEAQASLAEATTLRDVVARNVEEMERARDVTARALKRATGERALRRDVMRNLGQVKETLRATLRFSSGLVESMSESLLRCLPVHHPLGTVGLPTGAALLQPSLSAANGDVGVGLARLGGVRRLQDTVAGASPASTSGRHVAPAGSLSAVSAAFRQMASKRGRGAAGGVEGREKDTRESIRGVIGSLEDELFVLDDKYESLLKEAQQITAIINSGQSDADPGILEEKEVVDRAIREIKAVMSAKGAQIRQLESYLEIL